MSGNWLSRRFFSAKRPAQRQRLRTTLAAEPLESRLLLASDVYADVVLDYVEGPGVGDATEAPPNGNDNPAAALGAPEFDATSGSGLFVSLGESGTLVLGFLDNLVLDGPGPDFTVVEVGSPETAEVFGSSDGGVTFVSLGFAVGTTDFDLLGSGLATVNAVKITDSPPSSGSSVFAGFDVDSVVALNSVDVINVDIDIKPGSWRNPINPRSKGLVPIAIFSTDDFDASTVDPASIIIAGRGVAEQGKHGRLMAHLEDVDGDGNKDLVFQVKTNVEGQSWQSGIVELTGETYDGSLIVGRDEIILVPSE